MLAADRRAPRALLLTAGLGTRLQPLTYVRAKAAVPINGEPLVRRVIRILATAGIRDLVLNLHHRPQSIAACVGDGSDLDVRVRYSWEQPVLGSAGGPRRALPLVVDTIGRRLPHRQRRYADRRRYLVAHRAASGIGRTRDHGAHTESATEPLRRRRRHRGWLGDRFHACGGRPAQRIRRARFTSSACKWRGRRRSRTLPTECRRSR